MTMVPPIPVIPPRGRGAPVRRDIPVPVGQDHDRVRGGEGAFLHHRFHRVRDGLDGDGAGNTREHPARAPGSHRVDGACGCGLHPDAAACGRQGAVFDPRAHRVRDLVVGHPAPRGLPARPAATAPGTDQDLRPVNGAHGDGARPEVGVDHVGLDGGVDAVQGNTARKGTRGNTESRGSGLNGRTLGGGHRQRTGGLASRSLPSTVGIYGIPDIVGRDRRSHRPHTAHRQGTCQGLDGGVAFRADEDPPPPVSELPHTSARIVPPMLFRVPDPSGCKALCPGASRRKGADRTRGKSRPTWAAPPAVTVDPVIRARDILCHPVGGNGRAYTAPAPPAPRRLPGNPWRRVPLRPDPGSRQPTRSNPLSGRRRKYRSR